MKTFLDTNLSRSKTFILYGHLKDRIWCTDLMPRDFEHYLVRLLNSRGYEHVIFYGEAGTKGAYCLDENSARFFFNANAGIPMPQILAEEFEKVLERLSGENDNAEDNDTETQDSGESGTPEMPAGTGNMVSDALSNIYSPGGISVSQGENDAASSAGREININEQAHTNVQNEAGAGGSPVTARRIRYALRAQTLREFLLMIQPLMLREDSHMAVVFYNILTTDLGRPELRDNILDIWEKNSRGNICLMLVPETSQNSVALTDCMHACGLESKFLMTVGSAVRLVPNPVNCIRIGMPGEDEIRNMLRYLAMIGTARGNRIRLDYRTLPEVVSRIQYVAGSDGDASEMFERLCRYIDSKAGSTDSGTKMMPFTVEDVGTAWSIRRRNGEALSELNKPGWESAYAHMNTVVKFAEKFKERERKKARDKRKEDSLHVKSSVDWGVARLASTVQNKEGTLRPPIPHFVLLGNPGTGKTTIARKIGEILHEAGILKIGHTVEVTKQQLTSPYVAGVPLETMNRVQEAEEGVLFIDEADSLGKKDGGAGNDGTGVEVIKTLNSVMTNPNHHLSIVMTGYEDTMEAVWNLDRGFRRRFGNHIIVIDDYKPELLTSILMKMLKIEGFRIDPALTEERAIGDTRYQPIQCMVQRLYEGRSRSRFGNADEMEKLAEYAGGRNHGGTICQQDFYGGCGGKIVKEWFVPENAGSSTQSILAEMDERFVGMENAKNAVRDIGLELEEAKARGKDADDLQLRPLILAGNPGTGKTMLAELLPRLFYHYHILGTAKPVIVNASQLADSHMGGTQEKVLEYIRKAQDEKAFLFVDEAHELLNPHFDGKGALKAFMAPTTDADHPFLACFAVYEHQLDEFLGLDDGGESRFRIIHMEDYSGRELMQIFRRMAAEQGCQVSPDADQLLTRVFERMYKTRTRRTGNARKVQRILETMNKRRRQRCIDSGIPFDSAESRQLLPEDIPDDMKKGIPALDAESGIVRLQRIRSEIEEGRTGAEGIKQIILDRIDALIYQEKYPRHKEIIEPGHYFFVGNPGTGKTTGARYLAGFLFELGLVASPELIKIDASDLVGQYLGETGVKTRERLENSVGRVLLIDEAYALAGMGGTADSYKHDAVNEIVGFLDDDSYRKTTCVIFAGYKRDMDRLYAMNEGLQSRVQEIFFEDFSIDQSMKVLLAFLKEKEISLGGETVKGQCRQQILQMQEADGFSNGRTIRKYSDYLMQRMRQRCIHNADSYEQDDQRAYLILPEDIPSNEDVLNQLNLTL